MTRIPLVIALMMASGAAAMLSAGSLPHRDDVTFTGVVRDAETGAPLPTVQVYLEGTPHATLTRANGEYRIVVPRASLPGDAGRLAAQRIGYEQTSVSVQFAASAIRTDIHMTPATLALQAVVATGLIDAGYLRSPITVSRVRAESAPAPPASAPGRRDVREMAVAGAPAAFSAADAAYSRVGNLAAPPPGWNRESYAHISENAFQAVRENPLSTFSIDVDRASYSNIRRFLLDRQLPPIDAVRVEEMVNYFSYEYPRPRGEHPIAISTEVAPTPWRPQHQLLRISLASERIETSRLPASNLVFLLDVSGSMNSADKLPLVQRALRLLVDELRPRDRVAIVVYAGAAGLVLPSTSGEEKGKILAAIEELEAGGSTAGGAGLQLAYRVARENFIEGGNNRVILATDGDFNVGPSSDSEMIRLVEDNRRSGTFLTVLGFGTGNLQDAKMEQIADHGNGNYAYIDSLLEARKVLVTEMGGTLLTLAKDVKLQVEFNPARVAGYRLIGYENRLLAAEDFNDDTKDAGELGAGHAVTALYEVIPVGVETDVQLRGVDPLRYQQPQPTPTTGRNDELAFVRVRYKRPAEDTSRLLEHPVRAGRGEMSTDLRFAAAVAGFGMILRDSEHRGSFTANDVLALARSGLGADREGYRADFIELVRLYQALVRGE